MQLGLNGDLESETSSFDERASYLTSTVPTIELVLKGCHSISVHIEWKCQHLNKLTKEKSIT